MRRTVLVAAAVAVAGLSVIGLLVLRPGEAPPPAPTVASTAPNASAVPAAAPAATPAAAAATPAPPPTTLLYEYSDVDTTKAQAVTCLIFNEPLDASGQTDYVAFLTLKPAAKPAIKVDGRRLCLTGLAFGTQYQAGLKAGLPAASGHKLPGDKTADLSLTDRPPLIAFRDGLVLPRQSLAGVPITTVNVEKLHVTVYRVPDRLISQIRRDQLLERQAYPYALNQIRDAQGAKAWEGELAVTGAKNATVTTLFPISQAIPERKPGVYVLTAENAAGRSKRHAGDDDD